VCVARAVSAQPHAPRAKPAVITGVRPTRSIRRPAGTAVKPEDVRKIAGPRPSSPLTPTTSTYVSDETAAVNWRTAELTAIVAERITVLRRIGRPDGEPLATRSFNQHRLRCIASMTFVPDLRPSVVAACFGVALAAAGAASSPAAVAACNDSGSRRGRSAERTSSRRLCGPGGRNPGHSHHAQRYVLTLNAYDPFFDRRLLVRLRIVKHRFQARFDFVLRP
jgi:hypothetical protein